MSIVSVVKLRIEPSDTPNILSEASNVLQQESRERSGLLPERFL